MFELTGSAGEAFARMRFSRSAKSFLVIVVIIGVAWITLHQDSTPGRTLEASDLPESVNSPASVKRDTISDPVTSAVGKSAELRPASELLPIYHPMAPYPGTKSWLVVLDTTWFSHKMHYYNGFMTCAASGCNISLVNKEAATHDLITMADVLMYHMAPPDFRGNGESVRAPAHPNQLIALMTWETYDLASRPNQLFAAFNAEHSYRPSSFSRDSYALWFLREGKRQGLREPEPVMRADARVWNDLWEEPIGTGLRNKDVAASWSSSYCQGTKSHREPFIKAIMAELATIMPQNYTGPRVAIFGDERNCMRNTALDVIERADQYKLMRAYRFHFSFENTRAQSYVTEKFYWALLRGQIPVVWGAPDIARHSPGPKSYIDASEFASAGALSQYLNSLMLNDTAYEEYHAWRSRRSFADYGDIFREEILELIWVANRTLEPAEWYGCRMCHALERFKASGAQPKMGLQHMKETTYSGWEEGPS